MKIAGIVAAGVLAWGLMWAKPARATELTFWGPGALGDARAIGIAPNGEIWVGTSGRIAIFGADGVFKRYDSRVNAQINSITFDAQGEPLIGLNGGGFDWFRGKEPRNSGGFSKYSPWEVALDDAGNAYAADTYGANIKKFKSVGELVLLQQTLKAPDTDPLESPYSLALDTRNRLYVSDQGKPGLWRFNADGSFDQKLFPDQKCWRLKRGPDGIYVATDSGVMILDAHSGELVRKTAIPGGYDGAMGFAVDTAGNVYEGNFVGGRVRKYAPDGKLLQTIGPNYRATVTVPDVWTSGQSVSLPVKVETIATKPLGNASPNFSVALQPANFPGEPDSNFANYQSATTDQIWWTRRQAQYAAGERALTLQQSDAALQVSVPPTIATNIYRLVVRADAGTTEGEPTREIGQPIGVMGDTKASLTLYVPHLRSVFAPSEQAELNVIMRSAEALPAGTLRFSLASRVGDSLNFQAKAPLWKQFAVAALKANSAQTLTFHLDAGAFFAGRYQIQVEYTPASSGSHQKLRDVWPLEIVSGVSASRFHILFPEWSAGYTDIWGPFTGKGMRADSAGMAHEGIEIYDSTILSRGQNADVTPFGPEAQTAPALMAQAAQQNAFPAPERFMAASPLEIELQEALRNGTPMQRDIWGSHFLGNWGYGDPMGIQRDNRAVKMWTQWQREWPSWLGHRYLSLSIDEGDNPERVALKDKLKAQQGLVPPTNADLDWVRNGHQRRYISDADVPMDGDISALEADKDGNIYMATMAGDLLKLNPQGKLLSKTPINVGLLDLCVAPDDTVYGVADGVITKTTPDGKTIRWPAEGFGSYAPRGICLASDGTLLISDGPNARVRRFTTDGKFLSDIGDKSSLNHPEGVSVARDGTIYVADGGRGGLVVFKPDGTPLKFLAGTVDSIFCGKSDVWAASDDTLWTTRGGSLEHCDRDGKQLGAVGRATFAPGGTNLPTVVSMTPDGNLLVGCAPLPYGQELKPTGEPVRLLGLNTLVADVRLDRQRYTWSDHIIGTVFMPLPSQQGDSKATMQAWAQLHDPKATTPSEKWQPLKVQPYGSSDFSITPPKLKGDVTVRLVWALPGATPDNPQHADFSIQLSDTLSTNDQQRAADIVNRQETWVHDWAQARMDTLVRWTNLSDAVAKSAGHAPTQDLAPTNYGTPDSLAEGVYVPYRRDAVVAEAENVGHDAGSFPLMGPFYVARALEGPNPKPAWCSLLSWYWFKSDTKRYPSPRAMRDVIDLLGAGASGIGVGKLVTTMDAKQLALHRKIVDRLHRVGDATTNLELPGKNGVAILHSFTQEAMDPYMLEHFYTAHALFYDLLRLHIPTAIVSEESIAADGLPGRFKAVVLADIEHPLPPATMAGLKRFQQVGGEVWIDLGSRISVPGDRLLKARYRSFWSEDTYYQFRGGIGVGGYDGNWEYWRMRQGSNSRLPALKAAFGKLSIAPVVSADPDVMVQQRCGGAATYVFVGNDHFPDQPLYKTWLAYDSPAPASVPFTFNVPAGGALYDALAMKKVSGGSSKIDFTDDDPARLYVALSRPIGDVNVKASFMENQVFMTARLLDSSGQLLAAVVPLEITIADAGGRERYHLWRSTGKDGVCRLKVPVGWGVAPGRWTLKVRELLSGRAAPPAPVAVSGGAPANLTQDKAKALIFDRAPLTAWLSAMRGKEVWIALGKDQQTALQPEAQSLAQSLGALGINAKIVNIADVPEIPMTLEYTMTAEQKAALQRVQNGQAVGQRQQSDNFRAPGPTRVVMRPLILLGDPAQNAWFNDIATLHLTRRSLSPLYPGTGRALVQYVWSPFYDGFDAVTIGATDAAGVHAGIAALLGLKPGASAQP